MCLQLGAGFQAGWEERGFLGGPGRAEPCCWPGSGDGVNGGREMAALPSASGPEAIHGVHVWAKSPKNL